MALIECPECGRSVSSTIHSCIHCGYRLSRPSSKKVTRNQVEKQNSKNLEDAKPNRNFDSIRSIDAAAYPLVRFILFRPIFLAGIVALLGFAIWFMVWTSQLFQAQCSALYDLGVQSQEVNKYGQVFGYTCMPNYSGTILDSVQNITDDALGHLRIPVSPLAIGIASQLFGLLLVAFSVSAFRKLIVQFRTNNRPDTFAHFRSRLKQNRLKLSSLAAVAIGSIAILLWTFPLLGPRCGVFVETSADMEILAGDSGLTRYFNYLCLPLDPALIQFDKTGPSAFLIGAIVQTICLALLSSALILVRLLLRKPKSESTTGYENPSKDAGTHAAIESQKTNPRIKSRKSWWILSGSIGMVATLLVLNNLLTPSNIAEPVESPSQSPSPSSTPSHDAIVGLWDRPSNLSQSSYPEGLWLNVVKATSDRYVASFMSNSDKGGKVVLAGIAGVKFEKGSIVFEWLDGSYKETFAQLKGDTLSVDCADHLKVSQELVAIDGCVFQGRVDLNLTRNLEPIVDLDLRNSAARSGGTGLSVTLTPKNAPGWTAKLYDVEITDTGDQVLQDQFVILDLGYGQGLLYLGRAIPPNWSWVPVSYEYKERMGSFETYLNFECPYPGYTEYYILSDGSMSSDCKFF